MKRSLISLAMAALTGAVGIFRPSPFRSATPMRKAHQTTNEVVAGCTQSRVNDTMPRGYPGAKLARKAKQGKVAVKHASGLRCNGVTI